MIELRPITPENHTEARKLAVAPEQTELVATIDKSLADAYVYKDAIFRIAFHEDKPVGYLLVFPFDKDEKRVVNIVRLMIDAKCQGQGLGRALLNKSLEWIESFEPAVDQVRISTLPENERALKLYRSVGFEGHKIEDGEVAMYRAGRR